MAASDSQPVPKKNVAFRLVFPIYKNDGTLISGATGLDSEISKDCGNFADCTNEATEIQSSGWYYIDLTSTEMNADSVIINTKTSSTGAINPGTIMYPEESGDIRADATMLSGDATAADNAEAFFDGTGYAGTNNTIPTVTGVTNGVTLANDAITSAKFDESTAFPLKMTDSGTSELARVGTDRDSITDISDQIDAVATAIGTAQDDLDILTGVDGATLATLQANYAPAVAGDEMVLGADAITATTFSVSALAAIQAEVEAVMSTVARDENSAVPPSGASLADKLTWLVTLLRNKRTQDDTTETVYADDGTTPIATASKTVSSGTLTRGAYTNVP